MKKLIAPTLIALILITLVATSLPKVHAQAGLVSSMLNRMEKNKQSLKSLRANISMTKYNSQLGDSDNYSGIVLYIPGAAGSSSAFVRLEWTKPQSGSSPENATQTCLLRQAETQHSNSHEKNSHHWIHRNHGRLAPSR